MSNAPESSSTAVERALAILEAVAERRAGMTNSEISRRIGIPKSTASYILRTLERRGYLFREGVGGRYKLGLKLLNLSRGMLTNLDVREVSLPVLKQFVTRTHLSAHLAILDRGRAVYVEKVEAAGFIKMDIWVGKRVEVHTTGVGKALASLLPAEQVEGILKERGMKRHTTHTITTRAAFLRELERVRARGYAVDDEENSEGVRCVAAPIFNSQGEVVAAVGTSATVGQLDRTHLPKVVELVKESARKISQQLGYQEPPRSPGARTR